jgi:hypothetical protein
MRRIIGLCAALAAAAAPALALQAGAGAPFAPPTPMIDAGRAKSGAKSVARTFTLNGWHGTLEKTTFDEVRKRFGGQVARQGDAGESLAWLCYDLPARHLRVWLTAGELHIQLHQIDGVTIWSVPTPANSPSCPVPPGREAADIDGISPGQDTASVVARLGTPGFAKDSWLAYRHEAPAGGDYTESDALTVNSEKGRVSHLQASRVTAN